MLFRLQNTCKAKVCCNCRHGQRPSDKRKNLTETSASIEALFLFLGRYCYYSPVCNPSFKNCNNGCSVSKLVHTFFTRSFDVRSASENFCRATQLFSLMYSIA